MTIAVRKTTRPYLKIEQLRREAVEGFIDQLIGLLDDIDGDENLEPSCGWTPYEAATGRYADGLGDEEEEFVNEDGYEEGV